MGAGPVTRRLRLALILEPARLVIPDPDREAGTRVARGRRRRAVVALTRRRVPVPARRADGGSPSSGSQTSATRGSSLDGSSGGARARGSQASRGQAQARTGYGPGYPSHYPGYGHGYYPGYGYGYYPSYGYGYYPRYGYGYSPWYGYGYGYPLQSELRVWFSIFLRSVPGVWLRAAVDPTATMTVTITPTTGNRRAPFASGPTLGTRASTLMAPSWAPWTSSMVWATTSRSKPAGTRSNCEPTDTRATRQKSAVRAGRTMTERANLKKNN